MNSLDTNINNYSIEDLLKILNIQSGDKFLIEDSINKVIAKMQSEGKSNLVMFFEEAKEKIMNKFDEENDSDEDNEQNNENSQLGNWWQNQYPAQNNINQMNKTTDRKEKVQLFDDNSHFQMNRERIGINQGLTLPVAQGTINPNQKNITTRIVNIDSQFRQNILPCSGNDTNSPSFNTSFSFDLAENLTNVISIRLYSIQIPTTWYTFDKSLGNTVFQIDYGGNDGTCYILPDGNYTLDSLKTALNNLGLPAGISFDYNPATNIITISNSTGTDLKIIYYSLNGFSDANNNSCTATCGQESSINQNIGWYLGFREELDTVTNQISITVPAADGGVDGTISGCSPIEIYGPKYFILKLDDFNKNRVDKGISGVIQTDSKLNLPSYYNPSVMECINSSTDEVGVTQQAPRTLTQAQLYSISEILSNRTKSRTRASAPSTNNSLAIIPLRNINRPNPFIDTSSLLLINKREYFGPVDISRMKVELLDDKGNYVNLHHSDWSFSILVDELYQY